MTQLLLAFANIEQMGNLTGQILPCYAQQSVKKTALHRRQVAYFLLQQLLEKIPRAEKLACLRHITLAENGRPQLSIKNADFNLSHSGSWVAVALLWGEEAQVAIDIESPQKERDYLALLQHFACAEERDWFQQQEDKKRAFYQCWCVREAVLKASGVGLRKLRTVQHSPTHLQIISPYSPQGELTFFTSLPFYCALFSSLAPKKSQVFRWQEKGLQEIFPLPFMRYQVSPQIQT